jgi:photosystem II stability/assembly factor-like uncharacterized protein
MRRAAGGLLALAAAGPAGGETLFGLVDTGELYASTNGGVNWSLRSTLPARDAVDLTAGSAAGELYMITESGTFYHSSDSGMTWTVRSLLYNLVAILLSANVAHAFTGNLETFRSLDGGFTFTAVGAIPAQEVVSAARNLTTLFVLTRTGDVFKSADDGVTWSLSGVVPPTSEAVEIRFFQGALYVLTASGELARSLDLGASWTTVSTISQVGMSGMAATPTELLATTTAGEVAVTPTGSAWTWRGAIGQLTVRALATDIPGPGGVAEPGASPPPPPALRLAAPWPNPGRDIVYLAVDLEAPGATAIDLYDATGRKVGTPFPEAVLPAGRTQITWRPGSLARGEYWLRAWPGGGAAHSARQKLVWLGAR